MMKVVMTMDKEDIKFALVLVGISVWLFSMFALQIAYINSGGN